MSGAFVAPLLRRKLGSLCSYRKRFFSASEASFLHLTPADTAHKHSTRLIPPLHHPMLRVPALLAAVLLLSSAALRAEVLPLDHPCAEMVKKYLTAVVEQDWKTAASMLLPETLERRQRETVSIIQNAPTMTEEAALLQGYNVKDYRDLEKLTPQEFYTADRAAWQARLKIAPETVKRKKETLKVSILGVCSESAKNYVHVTVRTSQETLVDRIDELFLISFVPNPKNSKSWLISPEMKDRPVITPLAGSEAKKGDK